MGGEFTDIDSGTGAGERFEKFEKDEAVEQGGEIVERRFQENPISIVTF